MLGNQELKVFGGKNYLVVESWNGKQFFTYVQASIDYFLFANREKSDMHLIWISVCLPAQISQLQMQKSCFIRKYLKKNIVFGYWLEDLY